MASTIENAPGNSKLTISSPNQIDLSAGIMLTWSSPEIRLSSPAGVLDLAAKGRPVSLSSVVGGGNLDLSAGANLNERVGANLDERVTGNATETVTGTLDETVSGSVTEKFAGSVDETAGTTPTETAGTQISLKSGANMDLNSSGNMNLNSPLVDIKSGTMQLEGQMVISGNLSVTGTVSKGGGSFKIDDPLDPANKYLYHSFVESPDMMDIYNGVATLDAHGTVWITLPNYFQVLNRDFRYQLTSMGKPQPSIYIAAEISGNRFKIAGGKPGGRVSWQVTGIRQDVYANAHRIPVEEDKPQQEQGRYLHPELFGAPPEQAVGYRPPVPTPDAARPLPSSAAIGAGGKFSAGPLAQKQ
jgi:hypothetical protein